MNAAEIKESDAAILNAGLDLGTALGKMKPGEWFSVTKDSEGFTITGTVRWSVKAVVESAVTDIQRESNRENA